MSRASAAAAAGRSRPGRDRRRRLVTIRVQRAGDDRQPRPGLRLRGRRARPLERARGDRRRRRSPTGRTSASGRSRCSRPPRDAVRVRRPDPARARARLERRDRSRSASSPARWPPAASPIPRSCSRAGSTSRATPTTSPPRSPAASASPGTSRIARVADDAPAVPVARRPGNARARPPRRGPRSPSEVTHGDAAFTAGRAALLGAALASRIGGALRRSARRPAARALPVDAPHRCSAGASRRCARRDALRLRPDRDRLGATVRRTRLRKGPRAAFRRGAGRVFRGVSTRSRPDESLKNGWTPLPSKCGRAYARGARVPDDSRPAGGRYRNRTWCVTCTRARTVTECR